MKRFWPSEYKSFPFYRRSESDPNMTREINDLRVKYRIETAQLIESIKMAISATSGMTWEKISIKSRKRELVECRQLFCKIIRDIKKNELSLSQIGAEIRDDFDHSTVIHSISQMENMIETDEGFRKRYERIIQML